MENVNLEKKDKVIKSLAVAGLFAIIILAAWLAIQIVRVLPTALDSLASIASSVYNHNPLQAQRIEVAADKTVLKTSEVITLSWPEQSDPGIFTFSYTCQKDISLSLSTNEKNIPLLACDKDYELGPTTAIALSAKSEANSLVDVSYKISFFRTNDPTPSASHTGVLTITNPYLDTPAVPSDETQDVPVATSTETGAETEVTTKPEIATSTPTKPTEVAKPTPDPVVTVPTYIYKLPVSNPNGTTDLVVSYLGISTNSQSDDFSKLTTIKDNRAGRIKFSVHNIGTKTSNTWKFNTTLPGDSIYESDSQVALKPNERAVITVEFPAITKTGKTEIEIEIETTADTNKNNNSFSTTLTVSK